MGICQICTKGQFCRTTLWHEGSLMNDRTFLQHEIFEQLKFSFNFFIIFNLFYYHCQRLPYPRQVTFISSLCLFVNYFLLLYCFRIFINNFFYVILCYYHFMQFIFPYPYPRSVTFFLMIIFNTYFLFYYHCNP